jgi:CheY-like chemotaxis protein
MALNRILHVDDDEDIRTVTRIALEVVGGFTVLQCNSGQEALARAEAFAPDLILLDVMMPGIDGEQTFQKLREIPTLVDLPIVFATAKVHEQSMTQLFAIGAAGVVAKPFDPIELPNTLRSIWNRARPNLRQET